MSDDAWDAYVSAARRLDAVRRAAGDAATHRSATLGVAQDELTALRARLQPQRARLVRDLRIPVEELTPSAEERAAATAAVAAGPDAVLTALRDARATADAADTAAAPAPRGTPWQRNLLVYGPFAVVVLIVQVTLSAVADSAARLGFALLCSLTLPVVAWALGWVGVGVAFGAAGRTVDRTPIIGLAVCLAPILITCAGVGVLTLVR